MTDGRMAVTQKRQKDDSITEETREHSGTLVLDEFIILGGLGLPERTAFYFAASSDGTWIFMEQHRGLEREAAKGFLERLLVDPPFAVRRIFIDSSLVFSLLGPDARRGGIECKQLKNMPHLCGRIERLIYPMLSGRQPVGVCGIWRRRNEIKPTTMSEQEVKGIPIRTASRQCSSRVKGRFAGRLPMLKNL